MRQEEQVEQLLRRVMVPQGLRILVLAAAGRLLAAPAFLGLAALAAAV